MDLILSFSKKYCFAIPFSLLWGGCFLLSIINQWSYFWRRSFPSQFLLSTVIITVGIGLFFLSLAKISQIFVNTANKENLFIILLSSIISIFLIFILFQRVTISKYPYVPHTLIIRTIDKKNPASSSSEVNLLEIQVDGRQVEFRSLQQEGDWSKEEHMLRGRGQAVLTYVFMAELDPAVVIQFENGPSAGVVQIEYDNQRPVLQDLYSDQIGSTFFPFPLFAINVKHPFFLFVMSLFAVDCIVIFWPTLWLSVITYVGFRRYVSAGFRKHIASTQKFIKEFMRDVFQSSRVDEKITYLGHEINRSSTARALVLLAPTCYFLYYIVQGKLLLLGNTDNVDAYLPYLFAAKNALTVGQLPWWNPNIFNGTPLWGNPAIFFWYPFTWIELLAPRSLVLYVSTLVGWIHFVGLFLAAFLYFRILIGDEKWAAFSSLAYGFSIPVAYGLAAGNIFLPIYVYMPLVLYFLHSHKERPFRSNLMNVTISLFFLITGGFLQTLVYALFLLSSYVLFLGYQSKSLKETVNLVKLYCISLFIAFLLSAPSWVSFLYMTKFVSRAAVVNTIWQNIANGEAVTPINLLLRLFLPNGFGFDMQTPYGYVETVVAFCGVSSLFLAGMAVVHKPSAKVYYWASLVLVMLLLCFSQLVILQYFAFGGVEVLYGRLLYLLPLGIASLAGLGGKRLVESRITRWWIWIFNPFTILLGIVLISNLGVLRQIIVDIQSMAEQIIKTRTILVAQSTILSSFELLRALVVILVLVLILMFLNQRKTQLFWTAGILLLLLEVVPSTYLMGRVQLNPLMIHPLEPFFAFDNIKAPLPLSSLDLEKYRLVITEEVKSRRVNDSPAFAKEANQGSIYQYQSPWGYSYAYSANLATLVQTVGAIDLNLKCTSKGLVNGQSDIKQNAIRQVLFDPLCHPRLSDLMSVGMIIKAGRDWSVIEDKRVEALPRDSLFYDYEVIPDSVLASKRLAEPDFDIHKTIILEKLPSLLSIGPADPDAKTIFIKNTPNEVSVRIDSKTPALLLLNDSYSPGWTVEIDGRSGEIIRSNVAFRSVRVAQGEHVVTFKYEPPLLILSLMIQLFGMVCAVGIWINSRRYHSTDDNS